ncbi:MAG: hypothetical protein CMD33_08140 [Flavobacteriales bacterium]|nr:hypothetical protein [Flavobacteriales bacterium]
MPILSVDLGGTKTLAALVDGNQLVDSRLFPTQLGCGPDQWLENIQREVRDWQGKFDGTGFAVTGLVSDGFWSALNEKTLCITDDYPLAERVTEIFGITPILRNDAQAAAYGEFAFGAGQGQDTVFLTVSTGVGGGIVVHGRLLTGLAGHFGQLRNADGERLEDSVSGRAMERQARTLGFKITVPKIFEEVENGTPWAETIFDASARGVATLCANIKLTLDPAHIVIGGGIGLVPMYLERVKSHLSDLTSKLQPKLSPAALGVTAGVLGMAALHNVKGR